MIAEQQLCLCLYLVLANLNWTSHRHTHGWNLQLELGFWMFEGNLFREYGAWDDRSQARSAAAVMKSIDILSCSQKSTVTVLDFQPAEFGSY